MMALCLGNVSSLWGDIPYSEALNGSENRNPVYDSQQSIYENIQQLLDEGISDMRQEYEGLKPAADDIIFSGDTAKWIKTAYALKARYYMHLTKRAADLSYNPAEKALEALNKAMQSNDDDMQFPYGYSASEYNPFYSYSTLKYIIPNPYFTSLLTSLNDPRRTMYYKKRFGVADFTNCYYTSTNSPVHMMNYYELKFIEAEARLRIDENDPLAQTALQEAVAANLHKVSHDTLSQSTIDAYVSANTVLTGTFEDKLKTVIMQKYIAMFTSIRVLDRLPQDRLS